MPVINYKRTKTEVPARNFDTKTLTNDYDIALQDASGNYGVKSFFGGIRDFFKGVAALGTLTATSRITVTDANGNVTYTTPNAIKDTLGLATTTDLSNYTRIKSIEVADITVDSLKESLLSNITNLNNGEDILVIRGTQNRGILKINKQSNVYFDVTISSYYYTESELRYNSGTWQDNYVLNNILAKYDVIYPNSRDCNDCIPQNDGETRTYYIPFSGGLNKPNGIYNWNITSIRVRYSSNKSMISQHAIGVSQSLGTKIATRTIFIDNDVISFGEWV